MNLRLWLAYTVLEIGLCFTPGPAVFTVVSQSLRNGWRRSGFGALGIAAGNLFYFALSALGLGAFIATSPRVYAVLRWGGIAYLAYCAVRLLASRAGALGQVVSAEGRPAALFAQGLATQLSNPKAIVFFASFLAPFLDPGAAWSIPAQLAVFAVTTTASELPILLFYGWAASRGGALLPAGELGRWQDRIAGACLLVVAAWLGLRG
jgi:threonine/homoserine/homoserine lactone efflux protein